MRRPVSARSTNSAVRSRPSNLRASGRKTAICSSVIAFTCSLRGPCGRRVGPRAGRCSGDIAVTKLAGLVPQGLLHGHLIPNQKIGTSCSASQGGPHGWRLTSMRGWPKNTRMATWWHLLSVYVVAGGFAGIIAWRLLKTATPPGVAYVTFAIFAGVILLYLLIDTDRLADVPALRLGNGLHRPEQVERQVKNVQTNSSARRSRSLLGRIKWLLRRRMRVSRFASPSILSTPLSLGRFGSSRTTCRSHPCGSTWPAFELRYTPQ